MSGGSVSLEDYALQYVGTYMDLSARAFRSSGDRVVVIHAATLKLRTSDGLS
jgi:hypothetical protein